MIVNNNISIQDSTIIYINTYGFIIKDEVMDAFDKLENLKLHLDNNLVSPGFLY